MRYRQDLPGSLATHDHCSHLSAHCGAPFPSVQPPLPAGSETSQCLLDKLPCWQTSLPGSGALAGSKPLVSPFPKRNTEGDEYLQSLLVHSLHSRQTGRGTKKGRQNWHLSPKADLRNLIPVLVGIKALVKAETKQPLFPKKWVVLVLSLKSLWSPNVSMSYCTFQGTTGNIAANYTGLWSISRITCLRSPSTTQAPSHPFSP